ncbi:MAG: DUF1700 domain-containing protein [Lachnospiraceae bacterium]|nr:DUF1700 domain-containing protein [Lachnospiraceae bacterium]
MTKEEFLKAFEERLSGLSQDDISERLSFYSEMIDHHMENGADEETAVALAGPVDLAVDKIMSEIPVTKLVKDRVVQRKRSGAGSVILAIVLFPLWFPILIAVFAILFSLYTVLWVLVLAAYIIDLAFAASVFACIAGILIFLANGKPLFALLSLLGVVIFTGLSILCFHACKAFAGGVVKLTGKSLLFIKNRFVGRGEK